MTDRKPDPIEVVVVDRRTERSRQALLERDVVGGSLRCTVTLCAGDYWAPSNLAAARALAEHHLASAKLCEMPAKGAKRKRANANTGRL